MTAERTAWNSTLPVSKSPLERRSDISREPRRERIKPTRTRSTLGPGKDTGPDKATREAVYRRDGWMCACCGLSVLDRPHSVGHRKRRSQGGGNEMSNLLTFLGLGINPLDPDDHHARIDSRRNPEDEERGYTVRSWQDPAQVSVMLFSEFGSGATVYAHDDGTWKEYPQPEVAA